MAGGLREIITDSTEGKKHCGAVLRAADEGVCRHVVCGERAVLGRPLRLCSGKVSFGRTYFGGIFESRATAS